MGFILRHEQNAGNVGASTALSGCFVFAVEAGTQYNSEKPQRGNSESKDGAADEGSATEGVIIAEEIQHSSEHITKVLKLVCLKFRSYMFRYHH